MVNDGVKHGEFVMGNPLVRTHPLHPKIDRPGERPPSVDNSDLIIRWLGKQVMIHLQLIFVKIVWKRVYIYIHKLYIYIIVFNVKIYKHLLWFGFSLYHLGIGVDVCFFFLTLRYCVHPKLFVWFRDQQGVLWFGLGSYASARWNH